MGSEQPAPAGELREELSAELIPRAGPMGATRAEDFGRSTDDP